MRVLETIELDDVSTDDLESAVFGERPLNPPREEEPPPVPADKESSPPSDGKSLPAPSGGEEPSPTNATPPPKNDPPAREFSNLGADEEMALDIRQRNPDIPLERALEMARENIDKRDDNAPTPEPTITEQIAAIEEKLNEAGANDGLFTSEIASLAQEHSRLVAKQEVQRMRDEDAAAVRTGEMQLEREESYQRAVAACPDALDPSSIIGKELSKIIAEAEEVNNPLLYDPRAPEMFLAMANARLPESQQVELKRPAGAITNPPSDPAPVAQPQRFAPSPAGVLPVSAGRSIAQPATAAIDPSNLVGAIKDMPTADLEAAMFGAGSGSPVLLRL